MKVIYSRHDLIFTIVSDLILKLQQLLVSNNASDGMQMQTFLKRKAEGFEFKKLIRSYIRRRS